MVRYVESILFGLLVVIIIGIAHKLLSKSFLFLLAATLIFSDILTYQLYYFLPFYGAILLFFFYLKSKRSLYILLSGILVGLGFLFRHDTTLISMITILTASLIMFRNKIISDIKITAVLFLGGVIIAVIDRKSVV